MTLTIVGIEHNEEKSKMMDRIPDKSFENVFIEAKNTEVLSIPRQFTNRYFLLGIIGKPLFTLISFAFLVFTELLRKLGIAKRYLNKDRLVGEELASKNGTSAIPVDATWQQKIKLIGAMFPNFSYFSGLSIDWVAILVVLLLYQEGLEYIGLFIGVIYLFMNVFAFRDFRDRVMVYNMNKENLEKDSLILTGNRHVPGINLYASEDYGVETEVKGKGRNDVDKILE
jgi:hypothetical protein